MHDNERDIIDQIDEVTEPGPDAMHWAPEHGDESPNTFTAVLLGMDSGGLVTLDPATADETVAELVGDPYLDHLEPISGVDFWVPDNGMATSRPNIVATHVFGNLVRDVADGDYATGDNDREHARALLARVPVLFGPCLVTGVNSAGDGPGPLTDAFWSWFDRYAGKVLDAVTGRHIAAVLRRHGIPPEAVGQIVIIDDHETGDE
jgi:hypothetical protein